MFKFLRLVLTNFRSYRGEHIFDFPSTPGLYFITGVNEAEPRLESNGAGKSTLLDAIYWCLFGKTLRGLRGTDVLTRGETSCSVELYLIIDGEECVVRRQQSPNSLTLDGTVVEQGAINTAIRLNPESFVYSVIMPQFNQSFFELGPAVKLNLFSQILDLDFWLEKSKIANAATTTLDIVLTRLENSIELLEGTIEGAKAEADDLCKKEREFEDEKKTILTKLREQIVEIENSFAIHKAKRAAAIREVDELTKERGQHLETNKRLESKKSEYISRRETLANETGACQTKLEAASLALGHLSGLTTFCPTCLQRVDKTHVSREIIAVKHEISSFSDDLKQLEYKADTTKKFIAKLWQDMSDEDEAIKGIDEDINCLKEKIFTVQAAISMAKNTNDRVKQEIQTENDRENPYRKILASKQGKLKALKQAQENAETELRENEAKHAATSFWVSGFKRVRLFLIEETLKTYELEVNNCLASLGLDGWQVTFDIERENKSGGITKGFTVLVTAPSTTEPAKFESWSGGEAQRLQLAGDLGLANLIMLQAGLTNEIELFDEPSQHLSQAGLLDLAETLHQRAISQGKVIFLIDHHAIEFGDFADVITVVKGENGSEILQ